MTSAYETTIEREQQKRISSHDIAKVLFNGREPNNPSPIPDMEETSPSSQASLATGDSFFEESTLPSVEIGVLPDESFDRDLGLFEKQKENEDEKSVGISVNSVNDISRMSRLKNEESSCEDNERHKEKKLLSVLLANNIAVESTSACSARRNQTKDLDKDQKNRSMLEIRVQERRACDSNVHVGEKFRDTAVEDMRVCCENVAEICLDMDEKQDEFEIISRQNGNLFYDAVRSGNAKRVSTLIANGCVQNLDEPDWNVSGDPPLLMAATSHCLPVLR